MVYCKSTFVLSFFLLLIILCLFVYLFVCLSLSFLIFDRFAPLNSLSLFWRDGFRFYCVSPDPKTTFWSMVFSSVSTTEGHNCVKCLFLLYFSSFFLHSSMHIQGKVERETKKKRIKGILSLKWLRSRIKGKNATASQHSWHRNRGVSLYHIIPPVGGGSLLVTPINLTAANNFVDAECW